MIEKEKVRAIVDEWLSTTEYFLVDLTISEDDVVCVIIDHADGVWIDDCCKLSRYIEEHLSRDEEDYELEVGSAGIGQPFTVPQQYAGAVGKRVEVLTADGQKMKGTMQAADDTTFTIAVDEKQHVEGKKRPVVAEVQHTYRQQEVKYCKYIIEFK